LIEARTLTYPAARTYTIRPAGFEDIHAMLELFAAEVRAGRMLPRNPGEVRANLGNWLVAEQDDALVGCVSLVFFDEGKSQHDLALCEVRSLAVSPELRGNGLGSALISAALDLAEERGAARVLALTRSVSLFENLGFYRSLVTMFPEKVWRDCRPCPLRHRCDEVALLYDFEDVEE
jgi:N-acetylglutamate synthase-like GNAT family acetyltransferase